MKQSIDSFARGYRKTCWYRLKRSSTWSEYVARFSVSFRGKARIPAVRVFAPSQEARTRDLHNVFPNAVCIRQTVRPGPDHLMPL